MADPGPLREPQPMMPSVLGVFGGIVLWVLFSLLNFALCASLSLYAADYAGTCYPKQLAAIGAVSELVLTAVSAYIGFQALMGGRPFRRTGTGWRTAWLTLSLFNFIPWPCSVAGQTFLLGQNLLSRCHPH